MNVQSKPINKQPGINYTGFYQANIVVETDYNLQFFSGRFQPHLKTSPKTNVLDLITDFNLDGTPFLNVDSTASLKTEPVLNMQGLST
jgi:hypothetical protein